MPTTSANDEMVTRIRLCRSQHGWTQEDLANRVAEWTGKKPSRQLIWEWEHGGKNMEVNDLIMFSRIFNVTPLWLMGLGADALAPMMQH